MVDNNVRFISRNRVRLSKLKSAGLTISVAGILTVGAFEVEHETWRKRRIGLENWEFGKLGVKSVRLVGKFSQSTVGQFKYFQFIMRTIHIFTNKAIKLGKHAFGN